ncbi:FKBP-type peptidyl-prolyl cis-trans isomerase [Neoactinobaculum massilliense]|uniref:FKBP-type peptidyl-prolyl cis-trans isomerase n=1 Tax=Neoactinobaculum massilliense TaxID=2364794 RepID=UPI000F5214E6|nr:FKBP-type peptidyl-prolyl cis-trans isomerase [Neoactinobaculum massilliense]
MRKAATAGVALLMMLGLAACSGESGSGAASASASASASATATADAEPIAYKEPTCVNTADIAANGDEPEIKYGPSGMPNVGKTSSGTVKLGFPDGDAPDGLRVCVVSQGKGEALSEDSMVSANYVGQVWGNPVPFDSSFERGQGTSFVLTQVVKGWTYPMSHAHVGDKLIISIPADYGYGAQGNSQAGISGTDTIAFYVEITSGVVPAQTGQKDAKEETKVADLPVTFSAGLGEPITDLKVKDGQKAPVTDPSATATEANSPQVTVIARGTGKALPDSGTYIIQYAATDWKNSYTENTWTGTTVPKGAAFIPTTGQTVFNALAGIPVGSRVFMTVPGDSEEKTLAVVVDIVGSM